MPIYVYICKTCEKKLEVTQSFNEPPLEVCECGGELKKKIQSVAIKYIGTGFYSTDKVSNENIPD